MKGASVVGSITVCGLTSDEDHDLYVRGIRAYLQQQKQAKK